MAFPKLTMPVDAEGNNELHDVFSSSGYDDIDKIKANLFDMMFKGDFKQSINVQNIYGYTPLLQLLSCQETNTDLVLIAVSRLECDVNIADNLQMSPVHKVVEKLFVIPRILEEQYLCPEEKLIVEDQIRNSKYILTLLVNAGANANKSDVFGRRPLFLANDINVIQYLLDNGADINTTDKWGRTLLHTAVTMPNYKQLLDFYFPKFAPGGKQKSDIYGSSLLHYAAVFDRRDILDELIERGIDPNTKDTRGRPYFELLSDGKEMEVIYQRQTRQLKKVETVHFTEMMQATDLSHIIHKPNSPEELCSLLAHPRYGGARDNHEATAIKQSIVLFAEYICNYMGQMDARFKCTLFPTGSSEEGTKVGDPNEFDFVFCLDRFAEICDVEEVKEMKGFAELIANAEISDEFVEFFDGNKKCSAPNIRLVFGKLLRRMVMNKATWSNEHLYFDGDIHHFEEYDKPVFTMKLRWVGCSYKDEEISLDLAPAVRKRGWWPLHTNFSEIDMMTGELQSKGCLLLLQNSYDHSDTLMRISCAPADIHLMKSLPQHFRESYRLCKLLRHKSICPVMDTDATHDYFPPVEADDSITSYMLKNSLFHILGECKRDGLLTVPTTQDVINRIVDISIRLLKFLNQCALEGKLSVYFLRNREDIFRFPLLDLEDSDKEKANSLNAFHCGHRQAFLKIKLFILQ